MDLRESNRMNQALTLAEVLVAIAILLVLAAALLPVLASAKKRSAKIGCVNGLKEDYVGLKVWSQDRGDKLPMQVPEDKGGAMEEAERGNVAPIFRAASNELSTPKILICPNDTARRASTNFTIDFNNGRISYFVGIDASFDDPNRVLMGDDNLIVDGFHVKSGLLPLSTNSAVSWTPERHAGGGNLLLVDGSIQQTTTHTLEQTLIQYGFWATNRLAIP